MKTLKLKIASNGMLCPCHPLAPIGNHTAMIYAIENVPDLVSMNAVILHLNSIILAHSIENDDANWVYDWQEIGKLKPGSIVNRYPKKVAA